VPRTRHAHTKDQSRVSKARALRPSSSCRLKKYVATNEGKAWLRTDPYVALPFDPDRKRPELVGFLLHPISRSETWRRLQRPVDRSRWAHSKQAHGKGPWRRAEIKPQSLGGRAPIAQSGPIWRKPDCESTTV